MNNENDIFDDFDLGPQSDEFIPDHHEYDDWDEGDEEMGDYLGGYESRRGFEDW